MTIEETVNELNELTMYVEHAFTEEHKSKSFEALQMAINSLKAWDEVLNELEETKEHATDLVRPKILGRKIKELTDMCFDEAIRIINKKLSEVEK